MREKAIENTTELFNEKEYDAFALEHSVRLSESSFSMDGEYLVVTPGDTTPDSPLFVRRQVI